MRLKQGVSAKASMWFLWILTENKGGQSRVLSAEAGNKISRAGSAPRWRGCNLEVTCNAKAEMRVAQQESGITARDGPTPFRTPQVTLLSPHPLRKVYLLWWETWITGFFFFFFFDFWNYLLDSVLCPLSSSKCNQSGWKRTGNGKAQLHDQKLSRKNMEDSQCHIKEKERLKKKDYCPQNTF